MPNKTLSTGVFLDANIFLRFLVQDGDLELVEKSKQVFQQIRSKQIDAYVHSLVIHEVIYVLLGVYQVSKSEVVTLLTTLLQLDISCLDLTKKQLLSAINNFSKHNLDFPDCVYAEIVEEYGYRLTTFDKKLGKLTKKVEIPK